MQNKTLKRFLLNASTMYEEVTKVANKITEGSYKEDLNAIIDLKWVSRSTVN